MTENFIQKMIEITAKTNPSLIAIEQGSRKITYKQMNQYVDSLARIIKNLEVKIVGVFMLSSIEHITSMTAIMKSKNIYLPLDTNYPLERLRIIFQKTKLKVIITNHQSIDKLKKYLEALGLTDKIGIILVNCSDSLENMTAKNIELSSTVDGVSLSNSDDSSYILFTSGSTGDPKAIEGSSKGLSHFINWEIEEFAVSYGTKIAQLAPISFDVSLRDIFVPLVAGGTCCIPECNILFNPKKLLNWIIESQINILHCVPSIFRLIMQEIEANRAIISDLNCLKNILLAGESLFGRDVSRWMNLVGYKIELSNLYGPSETTLAKFFYRIKKQPTAEDVDKIVPVGLPLPDTSYYIFNEDKLCNSHEIGEIYIKTPYRSNGYFGDKELTDQYFVQNPFNKNKDILYKTGDFGRYREDSTLEILGRKDRQVKLNGVRIELSEIEHHVRNIDAIEEVRVIFDSKNVEAPRIVCYYTTNRPIKTDDVRTIINHNLPNNFMPSIFIELDHFPMMINGKIDLRALANPEMFIKQHGSCELPANSIEIKLFEIWKKSIRIEQICIDSSFFDIGGTSLHAIKIIGEVFRFFDIEISIQDLYTHNTIKKLAKIIEGHKPTSKQEYPSIQRIENQDYHPLSKAQEGLWITEYLADSNVQYNIADAYTLFGELDINLLQKSINQVTAKHETLRSAIQIIDGRPKQFIADNIVSRFDIIDVCNFEDKYEEIRNKIKEDNSKPFNLSNAPLLRLKLFRINDAEHIFYFNFHHIICDGWSIGVFFTEIFNYYNQYKKNKDSILTELTLRYRDYVNWQQDLQKSEKFKKSEIYWHKTLSGNLPKLILDTDFNRLNDKSYSGSSYQFKLEQSLVKGLKIIAQKNDTTLFTVLMAVYNILLSHNSGQEDIVVGFPVSGRNHPDLEPLIGMFVNSLALRTNCDNNLSFQTFLQQVKNNVNQALENQIYPFENLVKDLKNERDSSRHPIFDTMLVLQNFEEPTIDTSTLQYKHFETQTDISWFDVMFNCIEIDGVINIKIVFDINLFAISTVKQLASQFIRITQVVIEQPNVIISSI